MKIKTKLVLSFLVISGITGLLGISSIYELGTIEKSTQLIPEKIKQVNLSSEIDGHAQLIRYYDEVLTQSARNYAFTQEKFWEERYRQNEPLLDAEINHAVTDGDETITRLFEDIDVANRKLVAMEYQSIELVNQGNVQEAISILQSQEYWDNKAIYEQALRTYIENKGIEYLDVLTASTEDINEAVADVSESIFSSLLILFILIPITIAASIIFGIAISNSISNPIKKLERASSSMAKGDLDVEIIPKGNNEISSLTKSFNYMRNSIKESKGQLQKSLIKLEQNVSDLKKLDKQKDEFLAVVSHELRTPLVPIMGNCEVLLDEDNPERLSDNQTKLLKSVVSNSERLSELIHKIILSQRIGLGKYEYTIEDLSAKKLIDEIFQYYSPIMEKKQIKFENLTKNDLVVSCDKKAFDEILQSLLNNAMDFVPENGKIEVGSKADGDSVIFFVKDNGKGISPEKQGQLFTPFYQVDSSLGRTHQGAGLGLTICKDLVQEMGGKIWLESEGKGKGSTFYFSLKKGDKK